MVPSGSPRGVASDTFIAVNLPAWLPWEDDDRRGAAHHRRDADGGARGGSGRAGRGRRGPRRRPRLPATGGRRRRDARPARRSLPRGPRPGARQPRRARPGARRRGGDEHRRLPRAGQGRRRDDGGDRPDGDGLPGGVRRGGDIGASIAAFETLAFGDLSVLVKVGVQFGLFGGAILQLGTKSHHDAHLADLVSGRTMGCFAMTESGHGSNVQALGTVATYDAEAQEFVLQTTREDAWKDYIGNAAMHAELAVVFAQLEVGGEGPDLNKG